MAAKKEAPADPGIDWNSLLEDFATAGNSLVMYLKKGRTNMRLLPPQDKAQPFVEVTSIFRGNKRSKWLVAAWSKEFVREGGEENDLGVRPVLFTKTQIQSILNLQVEGWELFDAKEGHPIAVVKSGSGTNTTTNVMPSPKPVEVPEEVLEALKTLDMVELGAQWTERQENRAEQGQDGAEGKPEGTSEEKEEWD